MFDYQRVYGNLMKFMEHMQNMEIMMVSQSKICIEKKHLVALFANPQNRREPHDFPILFG